MNFDAWGRKRNASDWSYTNIKDNALFDRGYTGHEHLDDFGLINMFRPEGEHEQVLRVTFGRVYDPLLGRFLSPDNYVQLPFFTQNYNRFAYCLNNPLIYTDPSGQSIVGDFFKWVKKNTWDAAWEGLNNFAQWADQNGIPSAGVGYNSAHGTYHYMGNSGNVYHNQFGNNYEGKVDQAIYSVRKEVIGRDLAQFGRGRMPTLEGVSIDLLTGAFKDYVPINGISISLLRDSRDYIGISLTFNMNGQGFEGTLLGVNTVNGYRLDGKSLNIEDTFGYGNVTSSGAFFGSYSSSSNAYYDYYGPEQFRVNSYGISAGAPGAHANYETYTIGFSIPSFPALLDRWTNF